MKIAVAATWISGFFAALTYHAVLEGRAWAATILAGCVVIEAWIAWISYQEGRMMK